MGFTLFLSMEIFLFLIFSTIDFNKKLYKNLATLLIFGLMFLFAAFRGSGDADYYNYLWFARDIGTDFSKVLDNSYPVEFSFRIASFVVNILGASRQCVIVLMNFLSLAPICYVTAKKSYNPFLSALIFLPIFLQFDMQTSRTATAIGLGVFSIYLMSEGKKLFSILVLILSISFHKSAMILIPFLIYLNIDLSNMVKIVIVGASLVVTIFSKLIFGLAAKLFTMLGLLRMATKIVNYTFEGKFAYPMKLYDPRIIFALLLFVVSVMYFDKNTFAKEEFDKASVKAIFFGLIVMLIFRSSTAIAFRFSSFFTVMQMYFIPMTIKKIKDIDTLAAFLIILSIVLFILPYAIYIMVDAPAYDFFFTNKMAIHSLR